MDEPVWTLSGPDKRVLVVRVPRELSHLTAEPVRACVERRLPNRDDAAVVLDMTDVALISSVGVTALLQIEELARTASADFRLAALSQRGRAFLDMLALGERFHQSPSIDDAINAALAQRRHPHEHPEDPRRR